MPQAAIANGADPVSPATTDGLAKIPVPMIPPMTIMLISKVPSRRDRPAGPVARGALAPPSVSAVIDPRHADANSPRLPIRNVEDVESPEISRQSTHEIRKVFPAHRRPQHFGQCTQARERHVFDVLRTRHVFRPELRLGAKDGIHAWSEERRIHGVPS